MLVAEFNLFTSDWADEISELSTLPEFQTAEVEIIDPSLVESEYDIETGETITVGDGVIYSGRARVISSSRGSDAQGSGQFNPTALESVRVQLPREGTTDLAIRKGCFLKVTAAPRQPRLTDYVFTALNDFQGASSAARTIDFVVDMDSVPSG